MKHLKGRIYTWAGERRWGDGPLKPFFFHHKKDSDKVPTSPEGEITYPVASQVFSCWRSETGFLSFHPISYMAPLAFFLSWKKIICFPMWDSNWPHTTRTHNQINHFGWGGTDFEHEWANCCLLFMHSSDYIIRGTLHPFFLRQKATSLFVTFYNRAKYEFNRSSCII